MQFLALAAVTTYRDICVHVLRSLRLSVATVVSGPLRQLSTVGVRLYKIAGIQNSGPSPHCPHRTALTAPKSQIRRTTIRFQQPQTASANNTDYLLLPLQHGFRGPAVRCLERGGRPPHPTASPNRLTSPDRLTRQPHPTASPDRLVHRSLAVR